MVVAVAVTMPILPELHLGILASFHAGSSGDTQHYFLWMIMHLIQIVPRKYDIFLSLFPSTLSPVAQ